MKNTLLLVDDEKSILNSLERIFEEDNYIILTAESGEDALKLLEQHPVQVIISDQHMPGITGSELFKQVKKKYPETVRIILSTFADFNSIKDAINEGAIYKFLNKPCDEDVLRQQVREAFLINTKQKEKELQLIRLINYAKLTGLKTKKSLVSESEVEQALKEEQFALCYQPIVTASTGQIQGMEALIRWNHPVHGLLSPDKFLPLCEETGLILPVGEWVLRSACNQLKQWHREGYGKLSVAVNISARQFEQVGLLDLVSEILSTLQLPPTCLELEITESLVMSNVEVNIVVLQALQDLGVKLSLDDFGTGYSSLSYLKLFPINILKIDKSFIRDITTNKNSLEIISTIIALAKSLGFTTIAEGVEKLEQLELLKAEQCDLIQGYLFARPSRPDVVLKLLKKEVIKL